MDPLQVIADITSQAVRMAETLSPAAAAFAYAMIGVSIGMTMLSMSNGAIAIVAIGQLIMWSTITYWLCHNWGLMIRGCLETANQALQLFGIDGPLSLFRAAYDTVQRISAEPLGFSWTDMAANGAGIMRMIILAMIIPPVFLALAAPGLLALLAQLELTLGAAVAPLLLGFAIVPVTRSIGFGVVTYMVKGVVHIIVTGLVSVIFAQAIMAHLALPGTDQPMTFEEIGNLVLTSLIALVLTWRADRIASGLVGAGVGGLGMGAVAATGGAMMIGAQSIGSAAASGGGAAVSGASSAAGRAQGAISTSSSGRAFR